MAEIITTKHHFRLGPVAATLDNQMRVEHFQIWPCGADVGPISVFCNLRELRLAIDRLDDINRGVKP